MFIVYHFQMNDQTKRINQNFEQYLRHYINDVHVMILSKNNIKNDLI